MTLYVDLDDGASGRRQRRELRVKRRQYAETKAQQVPVKIMVPLVVCILPCLLVVVMGPAVLGIMKSFGSSSEYRAAGRIPAGLGQRPNLRRQQRPFLGWSGAGPFARLLVVAPGETLTPGTPSGKTGTALVETAGAAFNVTVFAVESRIDFLCGISGCAAGNRPGGVFWPAGYVFFWRLAHP